ncbi:MAG: hypothetical protein HC831_23150 [Chloroflexia bacterium]|nr:hypothetical protein [Chloroflexia bacterium]
MKTIEYYVKNEDIRNPKNAKEIVNDLFFGKDETEYIFVVDYKNTDNPIVTMSTGLIFQDFVNRGLAKVIIKNHKYKDKLLENPTIKLLMKHSQLEVW